MNENIDLTKILKDCPEGTKLYSTIYGNVKFIRISSYSPYPIIIENNSGVFSVTKRGMHIIDYEDNAECTLFPSKEQRDWSKFIAPWYKKKPEPKFKAGDWVVNKFGVSWHIDSLDKKNYQISDVKGNYTYFPISKQGEIHIWTMQDVKDGDVIFYDEGWICIFKCIHGIWYSSYCFITDDGEFHTGYERHAVDSTIHGNAHPATKEQRDALIKAMNDAGYEWDAEKKELKKLVEPKFKVGDKIVNVFMRYRGTLGTIFEITDDKYIFTDGRYILISNQDSWDLVSNRFDRKTLDDEMIKTAILNHLKKMWGNCQDDVCGVHVEDAINWLEKQKDKDKLIQELGEYKVKYTQEVLEKYINNMSNKDDERLRKTAIAFLKDFAEQGYENAVECIDWLEKQGKDKEIDNFDVLPGLYKCVRRMFDGTPDCRLLFEVGNIYKCLSKHNRAEFEVSYGHSVYLEDPVVCKHFIPVEK